AALDAVDRFDIHLQVRAVGPVARIGEPDATLAVNTAIVGTVVTLALVPIGQDGDFTRLHVGANQAPPTLALLATLTADETALSIETVAVGASAVGTERGEFPGGVELQNAIAGDIAEVHIAGGIDRRPFEKADDGR